MASGKKSRRSPKKSKKHKKRKKQEFVSVDEVIVECGSVEETTDDDEDRLSGLQVAPEPRYQVPDEYELIAGTDDFGRLTADCELFLVQVPSGFDPKKLDGQRVITGGRQKLRTGSSGRDDADLSASYEVQAKRADDGGKPSCQLLSAVPGSSELRARGGFHGSIKVVRSLEMPVTPYIAPVDANQKRRALPEGLRARYVPFGSEEPFRMPDDEVRSLLRKKHKERERRGKRKKKKKFKDKDSR